MKFIWDKLLDASIFYSFDRTGFERHSEDFQNPIQFKKESHAFVTGGTSGIGLEVAQQLAEAGVQVSVSGRDEEKGLQATGESLNFIKWDMANWSEIKSVTELSAPLDYLVLNAGGMPSEFATNDQGVELQFASQLFGHYFFLKELKKQNKLKPGAKVVWVSSGGMYLANIDLDKIFKDRRYDKVSTYANVKRAQVLLLKDLKKEFPEQIITAMHPGWVDTPGVVSAIPLFYEKMESRLRTPAQGADTILWILSEGSGAQSGKFYFDRKAVPTHLFWFTKKSEKKRGELYQLLNQTYEGAF